MRHSPLPQTKVGRVNAFQSSSYYGLSVNFSLNQILTVECKKTSRGAEYRGTAHTTKSGLTCQRWDAQYPNRHPTNTPETNPSAGLERNFCRNPDNEPAPWCYTTSSSKRFELCNVPQCPPGNRLVHEDHQPKLFIPYFADSFN